MRTVPSAAKILFRESVDHPTQGASIGISHETGMHHFARGNVWRPGILKESVDVGSPLAPSRVACLSGPWWSPPADGSSFPAHRLRSLAWNLSTMHHGCGYQQGQPCPTVIGCEMGTLQDGRQM